MRLPLALGLLAQAEESTDGEDQTDVGAQTADSATNIVEALLEAIPRVGIAIVVLLVGYGIAWLLRRIVRSRLTSSRSESHGRVFGRFAFGGVMAVTIALAVTVVFPSVAPVDLLAGVGVFSVAIGFAFQDILSNLLAGILLLLRQPFEEGDTIEVNGQHGVVQGITVRETQIKTFDGQKIVIPNAEVYQGVIRVQTAYGPKRTHVAIGLDDWEDLDRATEVCLEAVRSVDGVVADPAPQALFTGFGDSTTNFDLRWWTAPEQPTVRTTQDAVVRAVGKALKDAGISMPSPIRELDARESLEQALLKQAALRSREDA